MSSSKLFYYFLGLVFFFMFLGCGGASTTVETPPSNTSLDSSTERSSSIENLSERIPTENFSLDLSKVPDYKIGASKEDRFLSVINYLRTLAIQCNDPDALAGPVGSSLVWNTLLNEASQEHSDDMLASGIFSHNGSGTATDMTGQSFSPARASTPFERMKYNEYNYRSAGENIASRTSYPKLPDDAWAKAFENWIRSETGHCSNIMNPGFKDFAMAESLGTKGLRMSDGVNREAEVAYWTQSFASK